MEKYEVTMSIEASRSAQTDPEFTKVVEADNESEALVQARRLIRAENPEFNYKTVWAWGIRRIIPGGN
jgi:hypothetical protein